MNVTFELRPDLSPAPGPDDLASMFDALQPGAFGQYFCDDIGLPVRLCGGGSAQVLVKQQK